MRVSFTHSGSEQLRRGIGLLEDDGARRKFGRDSALRIERRAKDNVNGLVLKSRTGHGFGSVTIDLTDLPRTFAVGSPLVYLAAHETGATITPRTSKLLTIPLDAAKTEKGVARFSAREAASRYEYTFWHAFRGDNPILWGSTGSKLTPLFVGVRSVTLKARPWLRPAFDDSLPEMEALLVKRLEERLR